MNEPMNCQSSTHAAPVLATWRSAIGGRSLCDECKCATKYTKYYEPITPPDAGATRDSDAKAAEATPRTDDATSLYGYDDAVSADFARMLEREASALRAQLAEAKKESRIYSRCPACGNDTLIVHDKHLLCTWHACPDPTLIHRGDESVKQLAEALKDKARLDKLERYVVEVRIPLVHGSRHLFWATPEDDDGETLPSNLRAAIDAAAPMDAGREGQG